MEFIFAILLLVIYPVLSHLAINNYFAIKSYEVLKGYDLEKDTEIIQETGLIEGENLTESLELKIDRKRDTFTLVTIGLVILIIVSLFFIIYFNIYSISQIGVGALILFSINMIIILDKWLGVRELEKCKDEEYRVKVMSEKERLRPIRIFYIISSIIVIIGVIVIQEIYDLEELNRNLYDLTLSFIFMYLGGVGLIAKLMFLKIPIDLDGKLQPFINSIVLAIGAYGFLSSLYRLLTVG